MSMLTAAVIIYRVHLIGKANKSDEPRSIEELLKSSDIVEVSQSDINDDCIGKSKDILLHLCQLERLITHENGVPAFQMLGHGSFVEYLCDKSSLGPAVLYSLLTKSDMTVLQDVSQLKTTDDTAVHEASERDIAIAMLGALNDLSSSPHGPSHDILDALCSIEEGVCAALGCVQFITASGGLSVYKYLSNLRRMDELGESYEEISSVILAFSKLMSHYSTAMDDFDSSGAQVSQLVDENGEDELHHKESDDFLYYNLLKQTDKDLSDSEHDSARSQVRELLSSVPLGVSCVEYVMWDTSFKNSDNLLTFIVDEKDFLTSKRADVSYIAVSDMDAVAVCSSPPSLVLLREKLTSLNWSVIASWCLAASAEIIDVIELRALFQAEFLSKMENSGFQGMSILLDIGVSICLSTAVEVRGVVLAFIIEVIAKCCDISVDTVQTEMVGHVMQLDSKEENGERGCFKSLLWQIVRAACCDPSDRRLAVIAGHRMKIYENTAVATSEGNTKEDILNVSYSNASLFHEDKIKAESLQDNFNNDESEESMISTANVTGDVAITTAERAAADGTQVDPRGAIEKLLQSDFGYSESGERPPQDSPVTVKLRNALEHLSTSLYCSDVHFVSELVQNADDNEYSASRKPTLLIQLYAHAVVIYNNEIGFSKSNIIAICNVGGSTKKNQPGYIGQKGIG